MSVARQRLVVCLEESLHIHNIRDMKILHTIRDTPPNPRGLCALSPSAERCLLAYPGASTSGELQIFDAVHLVTSAVITLTPPVTIRCSNYWECSQSSLSCATTSRHQHITVSGSQYRRNIEGCFVWPCNRDI